MSYDLVWHNALKTKKSKLFLMQHNMFNIPLSTGSSSPYTRAVKTTIMNFYDFEPIDDSIDKTSTILFHVGGFINQD